MTQNGSIRIGVYICHCGANIAGTVKVGEVREFISSAPGVVVARDYKFMCSDPGQELIRKDIPELNLNRVVVAACSPLMHELTFRNAARKAGLNRYLVQIANIREHCSWIHDDTRMATEKAKALVMGGVRRVALHQPLEPMSASVNPNVLIVGAGISGIQAALEIAESGQQVYLVEREPTIGGRMGQFDKTFPTLDCSACILMPKMTAVGSHPNITLWTYSDVVKLDGYVGNYKVTVKRKPKYIDEEKCIGCLLCIEKCVFKEAKFPNEFDLGLGKRKPVYLPFPQAVPLKAVIDPQTCLKLKTGKCKETCVEACDKDAVVLDQKEEIKEIEVGTVILSTGFKTFDPTRLPFYGYGRYPNVFTGLELERLLNSSGPTSGEVVLNDGSTPRTVGIVHCVGSRDSSTNKYCSRVCCMYSLKLAHLIKEHTDADIYNFYIDIRAPGKSMEEFYNRVAEEGVNFIRGKVADVYPESISEEKSNRLIVVAEDTLIGKIRKIPVDMLVLAVGLEGKEDAQDVRRLFNITCSEEGFFMERHPKLAPVSTFTDGIFLAGCCQGPKDIPDTVAQAGAAASEALALIDRGEIELEANSAYVIEDDCSGCKTCIVMCPYSAISFNEEKKKAVINEALCKGCGVCVATCPSSSIGQNLFEDIQIMGEIKGILSNGANSREV